MHHPQAEPLRVTARRGAAGDTHRHPSPLAFGAGASSRSWEGSISTATGAKKTAPRTTKPSGRGAAGCSLLCRWGPRPAARRRELGREGRAWRAGCSGTAEATGMGAEAKPQNPNLRVSRRQAGRAGGVSAKRALRTQCRPPRPEPRRRRVKWARGVTPGFWRAPRSSTGCSARGELWRGARLGVGAHPAAFVTHTSGCGRRARRQAASAGIAFETGLVGKSNLS